LVKHFGVALKMKPSAANVEGENLLSQFKIAVCEGGHKHVVLVVKNPTISLTHSLHIGATVGLSGVPQPCD
jgi:hypothetical protein